MVQSIVSRVTVEVKRVENVFHHVSFLVLQYMVSKDPREGHLNRELGDGTFVYRGYPETGMCGVGYLYSVSHGEL